MRCEERYQMSPAVLLYRRMELIRKGYVISFHDLCVSDIRLMKEMVEELDYRHPNKGYYLMILRILIASEEIAESYNMRYKHFERCVRLQPLFNWELSQAALIDSVMHIPLRLPGHRNKFRAVQVAFNIAYNESLTN